MKYFLPLVIFLFCTSFIFSQDTSSTHKILLQFSEPIQHTDLITKNNYTVFDDSLNTVNIRDVAAVEGDSAVVLFVDWLPYKTNFAVRVFNVRDTSGNVINDNNTAWFYFDGYNPDEKVPYLIIKE